MTSNGIEELARELADRQQQGGCFKHIFESIPDGILCADTEGRIFMVNPAVESLFGYREDELLGRQVDVLYEGRCEDSLEVGKDWGNSDCRRTAQSFEACLRKKDGAIFPAETVKTVVWGESGEIVCFLMLVRDISERKKLENNLRNLEIKFRTVADFTYDWECWLQPNGSFRYVSPSCRRLTGYSVEKFMDDPSLFRKIIHPEDKPVWDDHYHQARAKAGRREVHFRIVRADGEVRWIEHACQQVVGDSGELLGFRSSNRDITKRKNYEKELHRALAEIEKYKEQLEAESAYQQEEMRQSLNYENIIGSSNAMQYVFFKIEQISTSDVTVLLLGETGTGKELFARAIHETSKRKDRPLVKVNCASLPRGLIESELFGHEKGAFTSADRKHIGRFQLAHKGTIFLDEIGELPLDLQPKLLRVLQEGEVQRVGDANTTRVDVRVIAATNRNLEQDVRAGRFRNDLWYRLNVFPITAPPLRERVEDISQLVRYFIDRYACRLGKNITTIPRGVMRRLKNYSWPGNVRELENVIERAVINSLGSTLSLADELKPVAGTTGKEYLTLEELERNYIKEVLEKTNWKVSGNNSAAEILGLKRSTLRAKIRKYNISKP